MRLTTIALGLIALGTSLPAQPLSRPFSSTLPVDRFAVRVDSMKVRPDLTLGTAIVTATTPGSIVVVRVPVPPSVLNAARYSRVPVEYRLTSLGGVRPLSATAGRLNAARDTSVLVTLGVSQSAPAGRNSAVLVEFTSGGNAVGVPLEFEVPVVRSVQVSLIDQYLGGVRGNWTTVRFRIHNAGNANENVSLRVDAPTGWRTQLSNFRPSTSIIAGTTHDASVRVWIPSEALSGISTVRLAFTGNTGILAASELQIDVRDATNDRTIGPVLTTSVASAGGTGLPAAMGYGVEFAGNVSDSVRISGRVTMSGDRREAWNFGLAQSGLMTAPPTLGLSSPHLNVDLGATGGELSETGGLFISGIGARSQVTVGSWRATGFALRPASMHQASMLGTREGRYTGGSVTHTRGQMSTTVHAAQLSEGYTERTLDVVGVRTKLLGRTGASFTGELAYRNMEDGASAGAAATFQKHTATSYLDARIVHTPGGTRAFARAENQVVVSASRELGTRASVSGGGTLQQDDNSMLGRTRSTGWFVMPSVRLDRLGSVVAMEVRSNDFSTQSPMGLYSNSDKAVAGMFHGTARGWQVSARTSLGQLTRTMGLSGALVETDGLRLDHRVAVTKTSAVGDISVAWNNQQFSGPDQLIPAQQSTSLRADRVRLPLRFAPIALNAEAQYIQNGQGMPAVWVGRTGATIPLPFSSRVTIGIERNPFMLSFTSEKKNSLLYTMRFDRSTNLPRIRSPKRQVIFTDFDGDGVRDRGETGVSGVVLRCGAATLVSDEDGRFGCDDVQNLEVDIRTLPDGMLAPTRGGRTHGRDIPLRMVHPIRVQLMLSEVDSFRVTQTDLAKAVVLARDSSGTLWTAKSTGAGAFVFEALPPGHYAIEFDQGEIAEPLTAQANLPSVSVGEAKHAAPLVLVLQPRSIRVRKLGNTAEPSATTGTGSDSQRSPQKVPQRPRIEQKQQSPKAPQS